MHCWIKQQPGIILAGAVEKQSCYTAASFIPVETPLVCTNQALSREPKEEPEVLIEAAAEVTGAWTTADPGALSALDAFHVWTPEYLQTRCTGGQVPCDGCMLEQVLGGCTL